jgi:hypothetical protein
MVPGEWHGLLKLLSGRVDIKRLVPRDGSAGQHKIIIKGEYGMANREVEKHYRNITFGENRVRLRLLSEFREKVVIYFENSRINMMNGSHVETEDAVKAREAINAIMKRAYRMIRLADIKTSALSSPSLTVGSQCQNIDLILNVFNLSRNNIPTHVAVDLIEMAISVYKSNRLDSFIRSVNPFYWLAVMLGYIRDRFNKESDEEPKNVNRPGVNS